MSKGFAKGLATARLPVKKKTPPKEKVGYLNNNKSLVVSCRLNPDLLARFEELVEQLNKGRKIKLKNAKILELLVLEAIEDEGKRLFKALKEG